MIIRIVIVSVRCFSYLLVFWFLHPKICVTVSVNIIVKKRTMHSLSVKSNCYRFGRTSNFLNIILNCVMLNLSLLHLNERKVDCGQLHFVRHLKRTWWPFFTCSYWRFNFCFLTVLTMVLQFCNWFWQIVYLTPFAFVQKYICQKPNLMYVLYEENDAQLAHYFYLVWISSDKYQFAICMNKHSPLFIKP